MRGTTVRTAATGRGGFALFAECVLTGLWLLPGALLLLPLLPAYAAACAHLERYLQGRVASWKEFAADLRAATREGWRLCLLWWAVLVLLAVDVRIALSGALPGGPPLALAGALAALAVLVAGVRAAARWGLDGGWNSTPGAALRYAWVRDPGGSGLLVGGLAVVAVAGWMLLPLLVPALGALAGCAAAVERRAALLRPPAG